MYGRYPALFGAEDDAAPEDDEGGEDVQEGPAGFAQKWGWVAQVDAVAELTRDTWDHIYARPVLEFLTLVCYRVDKQNEIQRQYKEQLRKDAINKR